MNKVILLGRLCADPELKTTPGGKSVTNISVAVKDYSQNTHFIDVVAWENTAEFICKYFKKGKPIVIDGAITTRNFEDRQGNKRKAVEVLANKVEFAISEKAETENHAPSTPFTFDNKNKGFSSIDFEDEDNDLPF